MELAFLERRTGGHEPARDLFAWLLALNPYDNGGVRGADQAWLHREMARPLWEATPGALAWLQRTLPAGQGGRR